MDNLSPEYLRVDSDSRSNNMRAVFILVGVAFAVALAYFVGSRLSNEAMAVVVGAVCGISASIPVSIGLVIASSNHWGRNDAPPRQVEYDYGAHRYAPQPQVIYMPMPQMPMQAPYGYPQPNPYMLPPNTPSAGAPREFKIIGDE